MHALSPSLRQRPGDVSDRAVRALRRANALDLIYFRGDGVQPAHRASHLSGGVRADQAVDIGKYLESRRL